MRKESKKKQKIGVLCAWECVWLLIILTNMCCVVGTQEISQFKIKILIQESVSTHQDESNGVVFVFIASIFR